jgi:outer membrane lipoprotein-sorting protein
MLTILMPNVFGALTRRNRQGAAAMPNPRPRRELLAPLALAALLIASPMGASAAFAQSDDAPAATPSPKPSKTPKADKAKEKAAKAQKSPSIDGDKQSELTADDVIDKADAWLDAARTMTADFVQVGPDGERTEGELYLMRPGRLLFRYHPPSKLEIVADGRSVAIRDQKLGTQDLYFIQQTPLKFLVADHIDLRKDLAVKRVGIDENAATIEVEDKETFGGKSEITLIFDPQSFALKQWTVVDAQGFQTVVTLFDIDLVSKPDPSLFTIDPNAPAMSGPTRK